jgi:hypothetical protein
MVFQNSLRNITFGVDPEPECGCFLPPNSAVNVPLYVMLRLLQKSSHQNLLWFTERIFFNL